MAARFSEIWRMVESEMMSSKISYGEFCRWVSSVHMATDSLLEQVYAVYVDSFEE